MADNPIILLIDDNVSLVQGFARLLQNAGYVVHTAYTAADGLKLAVLHRPDAIVLDFQMPLINGAGFLYRLRELPSHRHTPVMIVTGMVISDEQRDEFSDLRAIVRFKPIGPREFLAETAQMVKPTSSAPVSVPAVGGHRAFPSFDRHEGSEFCQTHDFSGAPKQELPSVSVKSQRLHRD